MKGKTLLKEEDGEIKADLSSALDGMLKGLEEGDEQKAARHFGFLESAAKLRKAAREVEEKAKTYIFSSLHLKRCFVRAQKSEDEEFYYITGAEAGDYYIPSEIMDFDYARQSKTGVKADLQSRAKALIKLDNHGHLLLGYFHSHPGRGPGSTRPSAIDTQEQEKLEREGYPAIGCIFSQDGYFRFYANDLDFKIQVYGKGVKKIGNKVYCFEE